MSSKRVLFIFLFDLGIKYIISKKTLIHFLLETEGIRLIFSKTKILFKSYSNKTLY